MTQNSEIQKSPTALPHLTSATLGYFREDGDFTVLATFSNADGDLSPKRFVELVMNAQQFLQRGFMSPVIIYEREDTPHYLSGFDFEDAEPVPLVKIVNL